MGYELRIHVGRSLSFTKSFFPDGMVDLYKPGNSAIYDLANETMTKGPSGTSLYLGVVGGEDVEKDTDEYGRGFVCVPVSDVITALEKDLDSEEPYRRFVVALAFLKSYAELIPEGVAILEGH